MKSTQFLFYTVALSFLVLISGCDGGGFSENNPDIGSETPPSSTCTLADLESQLSLALDQQISSTDFTFYLERTDGKIYVYNRGLSDLDTAYESASTSKWISAAIILWAVDQNAGFDLSDSPNEHYSWSMLPADPLYSITLDQLLSFTSGLQEDASCLEIGVPFKTYDDCINDSSGSLVSVNAGNGNTPNSGFYYSASHLQLAGAMAVGAGAYTNWQTLFSSFKSSTGLFQNSEYSLPSTANPRLAGGMIWTARDYTDFLRAMINQNLLSFTNQQEMFKDQILSLPVIYSPAFDGLGEQWHYGYGVWLECKDSTYTCLATDYYSSPGAYGAYPFINFNRNFFGIVARQGALGTYIEGVDLYRSVSVLSEAWADCVE